jgi:ribosomal protein S18 acetylase RimI-like enzyme
VTLRPVGTEDEAFLYEVYASTRLEELAVTGWNDAQRNAFLRQQFNAQHRHYHEHYQAAAFQLILQDGQPIGRLYVARWQDEIRIIDIALLPEYRNSGIGSALIKQVLAEADAASKPVTIHVEQFNPARHLYERLGFQTVENRGIYLFMKRPPSPP